MPAQQNTTLRDQAKEKAKDAAKSATKNAVIKGAEVAVEVFAPEFAVAAKVGGKVLRSLPIGTGKKKPDDGSNAPAQNSSKNQSTQTATENQIGETIDPKTGLRVAKSDRGAFGTNVQQVKDDPAAVSDETKTTIGPITAGLLANQDKAKRQPTDNDGLVDVTTNGDRRIDDAEDFSESENPEEAERLRRARIATTVMTIAEVQKAQDKTKFIEMIREGFAAEKISISEEEALNMINTSFEVKFPWIMISVCAAVELGEAIMGIIELAADIFIFPVGIAVGMFAFFEALTGDIGFFLWNQYYAKNASEFTRKIPFLKRIYLKFVFRRAWLLLFKLVPVVGDIVPIKTLMVIYSYLMIKKLANKGKSILENALAQSNFSGEA